MEINENFDYSYTGYMNKPIEPVEPIEPITLAEPVEPIEEVVKKKERKKAVIKVNKTQKCKVVSVFPKSNEVMILFDERYGIKTSAVGVFAVGDIASVEYSGVIGTKEFKIVGVTK